MIAMRDEALTPELIKEAYPLLKANWISSGMDNHGHALDPDFKRFLAAWARGQLLVTTLRDAGVLKGYAVLSVGTSNYVQGLKIAMGAAFYVDPALRHHAPQLLSFTEKLLLKNGFRHVSWFVVPGSRAYHFFTRRGFTRDEVCLEKVLQDDPCACSPI
jgi:GNAT superfamily N-acetyltransferase